MRINLSHIKFNLSEVKSDGRPCTAIENIAALAENPNGWMTRDETELCRYFKGSESDAAALLAKLEESCTSSHDFWEQCQ